jgi:hypothetical protein
MGLIFSSSLPSRESKTVLRSVAIFSVIESVFFRFSSSTDSAASDSSSSAAACVVVGRRIDIASVPVFANRKEVAGPNQIATFLKMNKLGKGAIQSWSGRRRDDCLWNIGEEEEFPVSSEMIRSGG